MFRLKAANVLAIVALASATFVILSIAAYDFLVRSDKGVSFFYVVSAWPFAVLFLLYSMKLLSILLGGIDAIDVSGGYITSRVPIVRKLPISNLTSVSVSYRPTLFGKASFLDIVGTTYRREIPLNALVGSPAMILSNVRRLLIESGELPPNASIGTSASEVQ